MTGSPEDTGDPACWLRRVCPECGAIADTDPPAACPRCGAAMPAD
jgi:rubrerythrin